MAVKIVLNHQGMRAMLRSAGVQAELKRRADRVAARAGAGMLADSSVGKNRARASVTTATFEAQRAEATSRALTRAVDAARG